MSINVIINDKILRDLEACSSGYVNFVKLNGTQNINLADAYQSPNIPYSDKEWHANKILDKETIKQWELNCFEYIKNNTPVEKLESLGINKISNLMNSANPDILIAAIDAARAIVRSLSKNDINQQNTNIGMLITML